MDFECGGCHCSLIVTGIIVGNTIYCKRCERWYLVKISAEDEVTFIPLELDQYPHSDVGSLTQKIRNSRTPIDLVKELKRDE